MDAMGDDVYQPDDSEVQDDNALLDPQDSLEDRGVDVAMEEGYSPPEKPLAAEEYGTTATEQHEGESLDRRLERDRPDVGPGGEQTNEDEVAAAADAGENRAGRLVAPDEGAHPDVEKDVIGRDVGIDGSAATAEEAAVHVVPETTGLDGTSEPGEALDPGEDVEPGEAAAAEEIDAPPEALTPERVANPEQSG